MGISRLPLSWPTTTLIDGADTVADLLTALLPQPPADHRRLNELLDLLRDQSIRLGRRVTDPALATWLGQFTAALPQPRPRAFFLDRF